MVRKYWVHICRSKLALIRPQNFLLVQFSGFEYLLKMEKGNLFQVCLSNNTCSPLSYNYMFHKQMHLFWLMGHFSFSLYICYSFGQNFDVKVAYLCPYSKIAHIKRKVPLFYWSTFGIVRSNKIPLCAGAFWCWAKIASRYYCRWPNNQSGNHWSNWSRFCLYF